MAKPNELTLRDRFAMAALVSLAEPVMKPGVEWAHLRAQRAYAVAESMMRIRTAIGLGEHLGGEHGADMMIVDAIEWLESDNADDLIEAAFDAAGDNGYGPDKDGDERPGTDEFMEAFDRAAREEATARYDSVREATTARAEKAGWEWAKAWARETGNNAPDEGVVGDAAEDAAHVDAEQNDNVHAPRAFRLAFKSEAARTLRARAKGSDA